jgi:hypothetical protein
MRFSLGRKSDTKQILKTGDEGDSAWSTSGISKKLCYGFSSTLIILELCNKLYLFFV